ncbi:MAG: hypothetical protein ACK5GI_04520 [Ignavibacteria bacterium]|jgi:hypothetical protein
MKIILPILLAVTALFVTGASAPQRYDVVAVYQQLDGQDLVAYTSDGEFRDVEMLFQRYNQNTGTYNVRLTRVNSNFYRVDGTSLYIRTRYCYEYGYGNRATLKITGYYGYSIGTVEFE